MSMESQGSKPKIEANPSTKKEEVKHFTYKGKDDYIFGAENEKESPKVPDIDSSSTEKDAHWVNETLAWNEKTAAPVAETAEAPVKYPESGSFEAKVASLEARLTALEQDNKTTAPTTVAPAATPPESSETAPAGPEKVEKKETGPKGILDRALDKALKKSEWVLEKYEKIPWYGKVSLGVAMATIAATSGPAAGMAWAGMWTLSAAGGVLAGKHTYKGKLNQFSKLLDAEGKRVYSDEEAHRKALKRGLTVGLAVGSMRLWLPAVDSLLGISGAAQAGFENAKASFLGTVAEASATNSLDAVSAGAGVSAETAMGGATAELGSTTGAGVEATAAQFKEVLAEQVASVSADTQSISNDIVASKYAESVNGLVNEALKTENPLEAAYMVSQAQDMLAEVHAVSELVDTLDLAGYTPENSPYLEECLGEIADGAPENVEEGLTKLQEFVPAVEHINADLKAIDMQMNGVPYDATTMEQIAHLQEGIQHAVAYGDIPTAEAQVSQLQAVVDQAPVVPSESPSMAEPVAPEASVVEVATEAPVVDTSFTADPGSPWAEKGIWGGMQELMRPGAGNFLAEALVETGVELTPEQKESFIHAIHKTLYENQIAFNAKTNFLELFGDNITIKSVGDGFMTVIPDGTAIDPQALFANDDFLTALDKQIQRGPSYPGLKEALHGKVTTLLGHIETLARGPAPIVPPFSGNGITV